MTAKVVIMCDIMSLTIQQTIITVSAITKMSTIMKQPIAIPIAFQNENDSVI